MTNLLLNVNRKVLMNKNGKVYKAPPPSISTLKILLDARKSASQVFYNYKGTSIDDLIQYNDTENVTSMEGMFVYCSNLTTIPQLNTSNITNMRYGFYNCRKISKIDITSMDKITSSYSSACAFYNCYSLTKLIIRTMTKIPVLNSNAFTNAYHFNGTVNELYNPDGLKDGRIYVPDDKVEELKAATNWSVYADFIVPLSTLEE